MSLDLENGRKNNMIPVAPMMRTTPITQPPIPVAIQQVMAIPMINIPKALEKPKRVKSELEIEFRSLCDMLGKDVYSYSKLNNADGCLYNYYLTYVKGTRGGDNVYSFIGGAVHDLLENYTNGHITDNKDLVDGFDRAMANCEIVGLNFPSQKIKDSYMVNMFRSMDQYKNPFGEYHKIHTEYPIVGFIGEKEIAMIGFIDILIERYDENGNLYYDISDFKTSSKFTGDKLKEAGRQLLVYKILIEALTKVPVRQLSWQMLKYAECDGKRKNSRVVKEWKDVTPDLNPTQWECIYDYTEEDVAEAVAWIEEMYDRVNKMKGFDQSMFRPCDISKESFFCQNLCGHSKSCVYFQDYKQRYLG